MYIITFKGRPCSYEKLHNLNSSQGMNWRVPTEKYDSILAHKSKYGVIALYIYHFGFTWKERPKGIEASPTLVL